MFTYLGVHAAYPEVARGAVRLFRSEHEGDARPDTADLTARVGVRDSKDTGIVPFTVPRAAWASFVDQLRRDA
ncbi:DUF397 domain-containing protein [Streptomyces hainanensis]|uniref:DUF397 domain-containing protein n=1 Tax=Streptomyces hainanensis TaxID=402648 RepID=UPI0014044495|nr:DUF397 domain-containing protein [Streptomyces hainanensis]